MQYHFDPSDPAFFFDISNLNFDNRYGALEFGMLGHMASGANETQNVDGLPSMNQIHQSFNNNPNIAHDQQQHNHQPQSLLFGQDAMMDVDWETQRHPAPTSNAALETPHNTPIIQSADRPEPPANGPYAYAIGARPNSLSSASPISISQDIPHHDLNSPALFSGQTSGPYARSQTSTHHPVQHLKPVDMLSQAHSQSTNSRKRAHDGDHIYDTVKQPYPYTVGFHRLLSYIKTHFSKDKIIRIAQALAAIRPALITFAQQLTEKDLIFMEVSVQRKLFAYDDFIKAYGTPTVIARRDGAIVAVSQEFVILTGWSKDVLLGKKPNLNTNHGGTSSTGASTTGTNSGHGTRRESVEPESNRENSTAGHTNKTGTSSSQKQNISMNVLIAEIMSQETVAEFYEDYARLAFGDPMGRALRRGKLLKYRTADHQAPFERATVDALAKAGVRGDNGSLSKKDGKSKKEDSHGSNGRIAGEGAFVRLGEKEGVVDCMYCWNVRRDNFEVPQLIVMNVSHIVPEIWSLSNDVIVLTCDQSHHSLNWILQALKSSLSAIVIPTCTLRFCDILMLLLKAYLNISCRNCQKTQSCSDRTKSTSWEDYMQTQ